MKIQIDTDSKVLRLESDVNLEEFIKNLKKLFPEGEWKEYKLETNVEILWSDPIYIDRWTYPSYPWVDPGPWVNPSYPPGTIMYTNDNSNSYISAEAIPYDGGPIGVYNVDM